MPLPTYLMSNFPSVRPSLNLQFDSQPTPEDMTSHLASVGATFSRASIGTYTDANGLIQEASAGQARPNYSTAGVHEGLLIEESRTNLLSSSEFLSDSVWNKNRCAVQENKIIAPDKKASADLIVPNSATGGSWAGVNRLTKPSVTIGNDYSFSVFLKEGTYRYAQVGGSTPEFDGTFCTIDLNDGGIEAQTPGINFNVESLTNGWYRVTWKQTCIASGSTVAQFISVYPTAVTSRLPTANYDGTSGIYVWGAQLEEGSFPTSYIPTIPTFSSRASTATYFDSNGVLQTASIDVARTDHKYIDGQWVEAGLLLEASATNYVTNSEDISGYTNFGSTDTASATTSPDNASNGTKIEGNGSEPQIYLASPAITLPSAGDYTISVFAKAGNEDTIQLFFNGFDISSGGSSYFDLTNGTLNSAVPENARIEDVGNGWYKCSVTATVGASDLTGLLSFRVTPSTSAFLYGSNALANGKNAFVYGFQLEAGSQPTSYIPTSGSTATRSADVYTTATKTRSADVCYIDGTAFTDFYNQEQGTVFFNGKNPDFSGANFERFYYIAKEGDNKVQLQKVTDTDKIRLVVEKNDLQGDLTMDLSGGSEFKHAVAFFKDSTQSSHFLDGTQQTNIAANDTFSEDLDVIGIGQTDTAKQINSTIKKLIYFPRALSDNELIKLTQ